jgi:peptidoglycan/xylan/chitin deacetylase (PgdA/CDA1 family)
MTEVGSTVELERGVFTLSLDFELIWGTLDLYGTEGFGRACRAEREVVIDRLLGLLAEYEIPATWFVLGHLMLDRCDGKHRDIVRPNHAWHPSDWFEHDPGGSEADAPNFLGRSLVEKILACPVEQEIGCHSFSHVIFGDVGCSRETAESELAACVRTAKALGIEMRSFAFPRNSVGHLDVLEKFGFTAYRGRHPEWGGWRYLPRAAQRAANLFTVFAASSPPVVLPEPTRNGLWNVPGSMIFFPAHGIRRYLPRSMRAKRAIKGIDAARSQRRVFHLWFHPTNLADQIDEMFDGLREIFAYVREQQRAGSLNVETVGGLAMEASRTASVR